jgi:hypothetical protein
METEGSFLRSQEPAVLSHIYPVHILPPSFREIHSNIVFHPLLCLPSGLFYTVFATKIFYAFLISSMRAVYPAYLILLDLITLKILYEATRYVVFSSLPPLAPSKTQIFPLAIFGETY